MEFLRNMIVYHGSKYVIEKPEYGKGNIHNDYGQAFYCTEDYYLAAEWAVSKNCDGFVNAYSADMIGLKILDLSDSKYSVLHWMSILLQNRVFEVKAPITRDGRDFIIENYSIPYDKYDVIIGWRADDSYFSYAKDFLNNSISIESLEAAMKYGNLGIQYAFKSKKAIDSIKYQSFELADEKTYFKNKVDRDKKAKQDYIDLLRTRNATDGTFLIDIIRGKNKYE